MYGFSVFKGEYEYDKCDLPEIPKSWKGSREVRLMILHKGRHSLSTDYEYAHLM